MKLVLFVIAFIGLNCIVRAQTTQNASKVIDDLLADYDKRLRPNYGNNLPVSVGVNMYILSLHSFSDADMEFTMEFYFRQSWMDPRLAFAAKLDNVQGNHELGKLIWTPDTFFIREKESFQYTMTTRNEMIKIFRNGSVLKSQRISVTFSCPMKFYDFPMDTQTCVLPIESYGFNSNDLKFNWKDGANAVSFGDVDETLPFHHINGFKTVHREIILSTANYSRLELSIEFERKIEFYLIQIYIPCTMLVIMSWLTFFLNRNAFNARALLCGIVFLSMIVGCNSIQSLIPKTSYAKAIDIFTGISMTLMFVAVIEFAFICNCEKFKESHKTPLPDKILRFFYPIFFVIFVILYWIVY